MVWIPQLLHPWLGDCDITLDVAEALLGARKACLLSESLVAYRNVLRYGVIPLEEPIRNLRQSFSVGCSKLWIWLWEG